MDGWLIDWVGGRIDWLPDLLPVSRRRPHAQTHVTRSNISRVSGGVFCGEAAGAIKMLTVRPTLASASVDEAVAEKTGEHHYGKERREAEKTERGRQESFKPSR